MMKSNSYYTNFADNLFLRSYHDNIRVYFDAADTLSCVQGIYDYYYDDKNEGKQVFNAEDFKNNEYILVRALLNLGLLGKASMTIPHQKEFINTIQRNNPNYGHPFKQDLRKFLSELINENEGKSSNINVINRTNKTALKMLTFLYPNHWQSRAYELITEKQIIEIGTKVEKTSSNEKGSSLDSTLGATLFHYLEEIRPGKTINNETDAIALHFFSEEIAEANKRLKENHIANLPPDKNLIVPIYFDRVGVFNKFLEDRPDIASAFMLNVPSDTIEGGFKINLIRESKFFLCYSLYMAEKLEVSDSAGHKAFTINLPEHSRTLHELEHYFAYQGQYNGEDFNHDQKNDLEFLEKKLDSYINYEFIVNVVIPCFIDTEKQSFLADLRKMQIRPHHILFENDVKKTKAYEKHLSKIFHQAKEQANEALLNYSKKYGFMFVMANQLPKLYNVLTKFDNLRKGSTDLFHIISLTRFFMPKEVVDRMSDTLLNFGGIEKLKDISYLSSISDRYKIFQYSNEIDYELYEILSLIWLTSRYHYAIEVYHENIVYDPSLLMLFGANFVRDDESQEDGLTLTETRNKRTREIIEKLEKTLSETDDPFTQMRCHTAIAFLYFQLVVLVNGSLYTKRRKNELLKSDEQVEKHTNLVLINADKAFELMELTLPDNPYIRLYITNIKVYFYVELGTDLQVAELYDIVDWFIHQDKVYPSHWHYRYDDTIARYFYRKSSSITNLENQDFKQIKKELASNAFSRIRRAFENAGKNTEFREVLEMGMFKEQVDNYFSSIVTL